MKCVSVSELENYPAKPGSHRFHNYRALAPSLSHSVFFSPLLFQTGEYATDEDEEMSPMFPNAIEVFDLAENEDMLSPVEMDPEKLAHKFKEVSNVDVHTGFTLPLVCFGS